MSPILLIYWPILHVPDSANLLTNSFSSSHHRPDSVCLFTDQFSFFPPTLSTILFIYWTIPSFSSPSFCLFTEQLSLNLHTPYMCLDAPQRSSSWRAGLCMSDTEEWSSWSRCFPGWPAPLRSCASAAIPAWCALVGRWRLWGWVGCPPSPHLHSALVHSL